MKSKMADLYDVRHDVMANKENILPFKANGKLSSNHKIINDMSSYN